MPSQGGAYDLWALTGGRFPPVHSDGAHLKLNPIASNRQDEASYSRAP